MFERFFRLKDHGTTVKTEIIAGITTFLTMAYIIFVQPGILAAPIKIPGSPMAGMDYDAFFGSVMVATCLSAAIATMMMGLYAKFPIGLASGMGENAFFAFTVIVGMGYSFEVVLGAVFVSALLLTILGFFKVRELIFDSIPISLKSAIAGGIGLFIAFIGFQHAGLIHINPNTMVSMTDFSKDKAYLMPVLLATIGLIIIALLMSLRVKGAILWGMLLTAVIGIPMGVVSTTILKSGWSVPSLAPTFMKLDLSGLLSIGLVTVIVVFFLTDMFDSVGTLIGVAQRANMLDEKGHFPGAERAFITDAVGSVFGAVLGTSTITSYIESASGIEAGGRTGLTAVTTSICFLLALFVSPVVRMIGGGCEIPVEGAPSIYLYPITAPVLIIVGILMAKSFIYINWDDITESLPAFLLLLGIPLTFSISDGLALGMISYPVIKVFSGRAKEVSWLIYILGAIFLIRWILMFGESPPQA
jgi:AGZA family xanthine/uracil permease-like MFS transporter